MRGWFLVAIGTTCGGHKQLWAMQVEDVGDAGDGSDEEWRREGFLLKPFYLF